MIPNRNNCQTAQIESLLQKYRLTDKSEYTLEDLKIIQRSCNEIFEKGKYRLHLFRIDEAGECVREWSGPRPSERNAILIVRSPNVFNVPSNIAKLLGTKKYFCTECLAIVCYKVRHTCEYSCTSCGESIFVCNPIVNPANTYRHQCKDCHVFFLSPDCENRHRIVKNDGSKRCGIIRYCSNCFRYYNTKTLARDEVRSSVYFLLPIDNLEP